MSLTPYLCSCHMHNCITSISFANIITSSTFIMKPCIVCVYEISNLWKQQMQTPELSRNQRDGGAWVEILIQGKGGVLVISQAPFSCKYLK